MPRSCEVWRVSEKDTSAYVHEACLEPLTIADQIGTLNRVALDAGRLDGEGRSMSPKLNGEIQMVAARKAATTASNTDAVRWKGQVVPQISRMLPALNLSHEDLAVMLRAALRFEFGERGAIARLDPERANVNRGSGHQSSRASGPTADALPRYRNPRPRFGLLRVRADQRVAVREGELVGTARRLHGEIRHLTRGPLFCAGRHSRRFRRLNNQSTRQ